MAIAMDDLPHPVPSIASLRWKENWLFIVMAPEQATYGVVHVNTEPSFNRARFTCNFSMDGEPHHYAAEMPYPADGPWQHSIGNGPITVEFVDPGSTYRVQIETDSLSGALMFSARHATFDFASCRAAAPMNLSFRELMTLGTNLPHDHHQQALTVHGQLTDKNRNSTRMIDGLAYRDHSYCMRGDSLIARHSWCALIFADRVYGVKTAEMLGRTGAEAREGYYDAGQGALVLVDIKVAISGIGPDGLGEEVRFTVTDVLGKCHNLSANLSRRIATVPLVSEKPESGSFYKIVESLCPIVDLDTGEHGLGHIELGRSSALLP